MKIVILAEKPSQARAYADAPIVPKNWLGKKLLKKLFLHYSMEKRPKN